MIIIGINMFIIIPIIFCHGTLARKTSTPEVVF